MNTITLEDALKMAERLPEASYSMTGVCYKSDVEDLIEKLYESLEITEPEIVNLSEYGRSDSNSFFVKFEEFKDYNTWKCIQGGWKINVWKDTGKEVNCTVDNFHMEEYFDNYVDFMKAYEREHRGVENT